MNLSGVSGETALVVNKCEMMTLSTSVLNTKLDFATQIRLSSCVMSSMNHGAEYECHRMRDSLNTTSTATV